MGRLLGLVGFVSFVLAALAVVRGHLDWARLASRKAAGLALAASVLVMGLGGSMSPPPPKKNAVARQLAPAVSSATAAPMPAESAAGSPSADAHADEPGPISTAAVSTSGLVAPTAVRAACRSGDPLADVYHPYRLQVVSTCTTVSGVVRVVRREDDGDVHFDLELDNQFQGMLTTGNYDYQNGRLVVEIVPADGPSCVKGDPPRAASGTYDYGICTGADVPTPSVGSRVYVTGPYVLDHVHDWAEIHPAWSVSTSTPAEPAPVVAAASAPQSGQPANKPSNSTAQLMCGARMSNSSPSQYSTTDVIVQTGAPHAQVSATAHYKSKDTTHSGVSGSNSVADVPFTISRATRGYPVAVDVTVSLSGRNASCSTSFTPH